MIKNRIVKYKMYFQRKESYQIPAQICLFQCPTSRAPQEFHQTSPWHWPEQLIKKHHKKERNTDIRHAQIDESIFTLTHS